MPARPLFPGQETLEVKIRLPAQVVERIDARSRSGRSATIATALDDFFERTKDQLEAIAARVEQRTALHVVAKERNDAEDALRRLQAELRVERQKLQSLLRSVQMTLRNMPIGERHRMAGLLRRVRAYNVAVEQEAEDVDRRLADLRAAKPEEGA